MTIVEDRRAIAGGVDTRAGTHVAAALDPVGGLLGVQEFPATAAGYGRLLGWLGGFGTVCLVGIEGTGSYGAGLARHVTAAGIRVVEAGRSDRQDRRRQGKSDPLDAVSAARAAQSGRARGAPKGRDGAVEAIRALMVAKRSAAAERTRTVNQARALILTGPDDLRARFTGHTAAALVAGLASLRPRPGSTVGYATRIALRELGRRAVFLDGQLGRLDELIVPLVTARAPGLLALFGVGPNTAALLLIAAGDHPGRLRSEAAWAHLCAAAPSPPRQGKSPDTGTAPAATGRPTMPCGGSCSPAWARTQPPAPTSSAARKRESPRPRSSAASSATSPARSTPTCGPPASHRPRGRPDPRVSRREPAGLRTIRRPSPAPIFLTCWT